MTQDIYYIRNGYPYNITEVEIQEYTIRQSPYLKLTPNEKDRECKIRVHFKLTYYQRKQFEKTRAHPWFDNWDNEVGIQYDFPLEQIAFSLDEANEKRELLMRNDTIKDIII